MRKIIAAERFRKRWDENELVSMSNNTASWHETYFGRLVHSITLSEIASIKSKLIKNNYFWRINGIKIEYAYLYFYSCKEVIDGD